MIGKVGPRGSRVSGLLNYLFGPGRNEEHTDPHLIAGWRHPIELEPTLRPDGRRDFRQLSGLLQQPHDALGERAASSRHPKTTPTAVPGMSPDSRSTCRRSWTSCSPANSRPPHRARRARVPNSTAAPAGTPSSARTAATTGAATTPGACSAPPATGATNPAKADPSGWSSPTPPAGPAPRSPPGLPHNQTPQPDTNHHEAAESRSSSKTRHSPAGSRSSPA